jgi:hypothetical protein
LPSKGILETATCESIRGWACDPDDYGQKIPVELLAVDGNINYGSTVANQRRELAIAAQCGGNLWHGFVLATPASLKDGQTHRIYVRAQGIEGPEDGAVLPEIKTLTCPTDNAAFQSATLYSRANLEAGRSSQFRVTMKNIGSTTWTKADGYKLGSQNPQDNTNWGLNRVELSPNDRIAPGQSKTFIFTVTPPSTPGTYNIQWKMVKENVAWFGALTSNYVITRR